jgi:hypothetical protein
MSRSGYSDDYDTWALIRWRGAVTASIRGSRGQAFLRELREALDAMPEKKLIAHELAQADRYCTLGAIGAERGIDLTSLDTHDRQQMANTFGIAEAMAAEIMHENDEWWSGDETPEHRWQRMRAWVERNIDGGTQE